ncbi:unnamed protein product [Adineta steineri]|nr:unnamed protein product [Adineta steineri]CAF1594949.1 unnamed protein product [Adineta steineri]
MDKFDRPIVNKILDYVVNLFSKSVLDQLAVKTLILIDFDDYLRVFDDNEIEFADTIKSSSQLPSFGLALSRRSSVSLTNSHATNLCHLSDKVFRSYLTTIQDTFLSRTSSELALQSASEFRLIPNNLAIFSYEYRLYLNLLTPSDIRTRLDQLPQINNTDVSSPLLRLRIELLIRVHTCFINSYHMEGICFVLDHARHITI